MNSFEEFLRKFILAIFLAVSSACIGAMRISAAEANGIAGQSKEITGRVVDSNGEPIAGAAVMIQGTSNGLLADNDGKFQITASEGQVLIVSMMGFSDKNVRITGKSDYLIIKQPGRGDSRCVLYPEKREHGQRGVHYPSCGIEDSDE